MDLDIIVANPSGNVTIFVMTPVLRKDYVDVAGKLLALPYKAEQVTFVTGKDSFKMAGLEFCGNAPSPFHLRDILGNWEPEDQRKDSQGFGSSCLRCHVLRR